jgi:hypothetical protein
MQEAENILDLARQAVSERGAAYAPPADNFRRIASYWTAHLHATGRKVVITADDVSPMMILLKLARINAAYPDGAGLDNLVDIVGYALCHQSVQRESEQPKLKLVPPEPAAPVAKREPRKAGIFDKDADERLNLLLEATADYFGVSVADIVDQNRTKNDNRFEARAIVCLIGRGTLAISRDKIAAAVNKPYRYLTKSIEVVRNRRGEHFVESSTASILARLGVDERPRE